MELPALAALEPPVPDDGEGAAAGRRGRARAGGGVPGLAHGGETLHGGGVWTLLGDEVAAAGRTARRHVAVNLHGRGPASHRALQATAPGTLVAFGCAEAGHDGPAWDPGEHEVRRWCRLVSAAGGPCGPEDLRLTEPRAPRGSTVVVHPGAASGARRWPVARWAAVAAALAHDGLRVVLTGSTAERPLCRAVLAAAAGAGADVEDASGRLDLDELADLVGGARLLLSGDTGVAHLATALGTPSVTLFGPVPPSAWGPSIDLDRHTALWHGPTAVPGDPHGTYLDPTLARITTAEVLDACAALLAVEQVA
ncbi:glycosyltransferase family 9 protein [Xylanimonas oleitrophica]|uniref:Glycosyltransferase family 9 protein n=1 Tax=Xylanimonas oleitrophica TaxID=2607479 RepID=A0A2W5XRD4_9MICO|nr:glycosyltransferase family 9 protein [Xylanimonas oleitrophica]